MGVPLYRWMVYFMEHPKQKWMRTGGSHSDIPRSNSHQMLNQCPVSTKWLKRFHLQFSILLDYKKRKNVTGLNGSFLHPSFDSSFSMMSSITSREIDSSNGMLPTFNCSWVCTYVLNIYRHMHAAPYAK